LASSAWGGSYAAAADSVSVLGGTTLLIVALCIPPGPPIKPLVILGMLAVRAAAVATGSPAIQHFSYGAFFFQFLQGLAHRCAAEDSTLETLQKGDVTELRLGYELAHVTYFPNLLYDAMGEAHRRAARGEKEDESG
jgi:hypothetical protein